MSADVDLERLIAVWLIEEAPTSAPDRILAAVAQRIDVSALGRVSRVTQDIHPSTVGRFVGIAAVVAILAAGVGIGGRLFDLEVSAPSASLASSPSAGPSASPSVDASFVRPFAYTIPAGSGLKIVRESPFFSLVGGGSTDDRGIVIASAETAWTHGASGRFALRSAPADFLADLRDSASVDTAGAIGIDLSAAAATTLDGRPALMAATSPGGRTGYDIHVVGSMEGLTGGTPVILLAFPYRLIVTEVDGVTVFVQIWARSDTDLAAWMSTAAQFVHSIHFVDQPSGSPPSSTRSASPTP